MQRITKEWFTGRELLLCALVILGTLLATGTHEMDRKSEVPFIEDLLSNGPFLLLILGAYNRNSMSVRIIRFLLWIFGPLWLICTIVVAGQVFGRMSEYDLFSPIRWAGVTLIYGFVVWVFFWSKAVKCYLSLHPPHGAADSGNA